MKFPIYVSILATIFCLSIGEAAAQSYTHTSRPFLQEASTLGSGDAGVALPSTFGGFFLNPAQPSVGAQEGASIRAFGLSVSASSDLTQHVQVFEDHLQAAFEEGYDNLPDAQQDALIDAVSQAFRQETAFSSGMILPQVVYRSGGISAGVGLAAHSAARYQVGNAGAEVPLIMGIARADLMGMGQFSANLASFGGPPLSVGATVKHTHRYASTKNKPLDAFRDGEDIHLMQGTSTSLDLGGIYQINAPWSGTLFAGAALYDVTRDDFDFEHTGLLTEQGSAISSQVDKEKHFVSEQLEHEASFRIGFAQVWGPPEQPQIAIALDYLGYRSPLKPQSHLAHIRLGMQVKALPFATVQGGLNQGYPAAGLSVRAGVMDISYAFYGVEEGRIPGQLPSWNHSAQVVFSW